MKFIVHSKKYYRKFRLGLFLHAISAVLGVILVSRDLLFREQNTFSQIVNLILFIVIVFGAISYLKLLFMYVTITKDRLCLIGWWKPISIPLKIIQSVDAKSEGFSQHCVLNLSEPVSVFFQISPSFPVDILTKDKKVISLAGFFSREEWPMVEEFINNNKSG